MRTRRRVTRSSLKRMCKYCDIREDVPFVCRSCKQRSPEGAVLTQRSCGTCGARSMCRSRMMRAGIREAMATRKRPDIRFEMDAHDVIVEVDENQHSGHEESCEWPMAARISEIVGTIGGKAVRPLCSSGTTRTTCARAAHE